jgi:zinc/manganese transport system substrate-binding protein
MKKACTLIVVLTLMLGSSLWGTRVAAQDEPINVVATFSILDDLVANVGGDAVAIDTLAGTNADAHTFEPSPEQVVALTDAAVIFENGLGFEPWLDGIVDATKSDAPRIVVSDGIELRLADAELHQDGDEDDHEHTEGDFDPHVWQSAANAMIMVENIRDALIDADPDRAAIYEANATAYLATLEELDASIVEQIAAIPEDQRKLVTSHDTFGYFADRYGFEVIGTPFGISTESAEPAASDIAALIEVIEAAAVPAIFTENVQNDSLIEQIANDAGVEVAPPLYTDALGDDDSGASTYVDMMTYNVETIVTALSPEQ